MTDKIQIGLLTVGLHIGEAQSLKAKRQVVKSIKAKLKNQYNISIAECGDLDKWQSAQLAICAISNDHHHLEQSLQAILNQIENWRTCEIIKQRMEYL